jgi:hypothetical protein
MAYDAALAQRIRGIVASRKGITEREMFGGIAFMLDEKMFVGVIGDDLLARVGPEGNAAALATPHVRQMDFTGRPMKGYVYVGPKGIARAANLRKWLDACAAFVATLPKKSPAKRRAAPPRTRAGR